MSEVDANGHADGSEADESGPSALTEANLESHNIGLGGAEQDDSDFADVQDLADDKFLKDELERVNNIEDEKEKDEALMEYRDKRREMLKDKIKRMHHRMENKLQEEVKLYEDMEQDEVVAQWKLEESMKHRQQEKDREAEELRNQKEEARIAKMTEDDFKKEEEESRLRFIADGMRGQLFCQHKKGMLGRSVKSEKFIRISVYEHGEPRALTWGGGGGKKIIEFLDIVNIVTGHVTQVFQGCQADEQLCFSIVTTKRTLDLEAHDIETLTKWVGGLRAILTSLDANEEQPEEQELTQTDSPKQPPVPRQQESAKLSQEVLFVLTVETVVNQMKDEKEPPGDFTPQEQGPLLFKVVLKDRVPWRKWNDWVKDELKNGFPALEAAKSLVAAEEQAAAENATDTTAGENDATPGPADTADSDNPQDEENTDNAD